MNYESLRALAASRGFAEFTALQEQAFRSPESWDPGQSLFVIGETSAGKTLIPLLLYAAAVQEALEGGKPCPKMLFVVPYRALAAQKAQELREFFGREGLRVVQSTGEFRQDDEAVQSGDVDVAVVINEKVYKYEARTSDFLSRYDYLVLDEIGLVGSGDRGIRLDFIFAWAFGQQKICGRPRTIALGTPFFDWSAYIASYGFFPVRAGKRPVPLDQVNVLYNARTVMKVEGECEYLYPMHMVTQRELEKMKKYFEVPSRACLDFEDLCPIEEPARLNPEVPCPRTGKPCTMRVELIPEGGKRGLNHLLEKICRHHLEMDHQIILFFNDRERVRQTCLTLFRALRDLLPEPPSAEESRDEILARCGLSSEDMVGILETESENGMNLELYQAFLSGVAFHSAALPVELRTYVEEKLLDSRELKIVCSTETLAFGVNSAVDVVVVADLYKHDGTSGRMLTMNEYQNYAGRAGRLRRGVDPLSCKGYVYTMISENQAETWEEISQFSEPERLYSRFHTDDGDTMPFFLLNLLPTEEGESLPLSRLMDTVSALPQDGSTSRTELTVKVRAAMKFLCLQGLVVNRNERGRNRGEPSYQLTPQGQRMRGFILASEDYLTLLSALREYMDGIYLDPDYITLLYRLLQTKHAEQGLHGIFERSDTRLDLKGLKASIAQYAKDKDILLEWLPQASNERSLAVLAAVLAWCHGESAATLYRKYGIHFALLSKAASQIAYLIEVATEILPSRMEQILAERRAKYQKWMPLTQESFQQQVDTRVQELHNLFVSVFYGVDTDMAQDLLNWLDPPDKEDSQKDPGAIALARDLSIQTISPNTARILRRIAVRYRFFAHPPKVDQTDIVARNNFLNQRWQYRRDVEAMDPYLSAYFYVNFPEQFGAVPDGAPVQEGSPAAAVSVGVGAGSSSGTGTGTGTGTETGE